MLDLISALSRSHMVWTFEVKGSGRRSTVQSATSPTGDLYKPGTCVKLVDGFAVVVKFETNIDGKQKARVLKLVKRDEVEKNDESVNENELLATTILHHIDLDKITAQLSVSSKANYHPAPDSFFIQQATDTSRRYTDVFNWDEIKNDGPNIGDSLANLFRAKYETPRRRRTGRVKAVVEEDLEEEDESIEPVTLFAGAQPAPEIHSRNDHDESMADEYSDSDNYEEADERPAKRPAEVQVIKEEFSTPKKARIVDLDIKTPRTPKSTTKSRSETPSKSVSKAKTGLRSLPSTPHKAAPDTPHNRARDRLHLSAIPESLPCREKEFSQIFLALESAIGAGTGTCVYVSGTPGTGKTATIREVIAQLELRKEDGELPNFTFLEINGMKLTHPNVAYDLLWSEVSANSKNKNLSSNNAMAALEAEFKSSSSDREPIVVLMDELDQLVTKTQGVMYNFFNWPSLPHSKLIVLAVANTMDLPERMLSNKISSRLGLTRVQFKGYTYGELRQLINSRLEDIDIVETDAVEFAARKVASVSGDARRALDLCRRAVELGDGKRVGIEHIRLAIAESQTLPLPAYILGLSVATKVILCSVLARARRNNETEMPISEVLFQTEQLITLSDRSDVLQKYLLQGHVRMQGFQHAISELVEAGILNQQAIRGEATANLRLAIAPGVITEVLADDPDVTGLL